MVNVIKVVGPQTNVTTTQNSVPTSTAPGGNGAGATMLYLYNSQTTTQTVTIANSTYNAANGLTFSIPGNSSIILEKYATDQVNASANIICTPIARGPY